MPQFTWIGKDKVENHDKDLPFRVLKPNKTLSVGNSDNLLIEGDNLEALKSLMPFYYNKIKCIYIDPPYNTGNEKWVYNDKVNAPQIKAWLNQVVGAEGEDLCRHDKWLCMMYPRLKLLHELLADDGVIFVSIDDNEHSNLIQIMNGIFGEQNFVTNIIWQKAYSPINLRKNFSPNHDFIVCYAKKIDNIKLNQLPRSDEAERRYKNPDNDLRGPWKSTDLSVGPAVEENIYEIKTPSGRKVFPPKGRSWVLNKKRFDEFLNDNRIWFGKEGSSVPSVKKFLSEVKENVTPMTIWRYDEVGHNQDAKREIKIILNEDSPFETPKPIFLMKRIISIGSTKDAIILDSFAGSGTTGQAVLELNKEDGGNRKFILVELERDIAKNVTAKRLQKVIQGYEGAKYSDGTGQGFQYLELNGELFDNSGFINPNSQYEDLASYIYFTETHDYLDLTSIKNPYLGSMGQSHYFLLFSSKGKNVLDDKSVKPMLAQDGIKVIYADKCLLDEEFCLKNNIIFKQIPYELKKF